MKITPELLESFKTRNGGYTKKTFELLDFESRDENWKWCPARGWKLRLIGTEISDATVAKINQHVDSYSE